MHDLQGMLELFRQVSGARDAGWCPTLPMQSGKPPKPSSPMHGMCSALVGIFPYFCGDTPGTLCLYARGKDYHTALTARLQAAADALSGAYPGVRFRPGCDASPINEVRAAALAGLGVFGDNGLFISETYGSFVFIATLATDAEVDLPEHPPRTCLHCGACARACPTGVIGGGDKRTDCLSAISQRKGELTDAELALLRRQNTVWGCDACQLACPYNRKAVIDPLPEFARDLIPDIPAEMLDASPEEWMRFLEGRAFAWRGYEVPLRNLRALHAKE